MITAVISSFLLSIKDRRSALSKHTHAGGVSRCMFTRFYEDGWGWQTRLRLLIVSEGCVREPF